MARVVSGYWACNDCLFYIAYDEYPTELNEAQTEEWLSHIKAKLEPYHNFVVATFCHSDNCTPEDREEGCDCGSDAFSASVCDVCDGNAGGPRTQVVTMAP